MRWLSIIVFALPRKRPHTFHHCYSTCKQTTVRFKLIEGATDSKPRHGWFVYTISENIYLYQLDNLTNEKARPKRFQSSIHLRLHLRLHLQLHIIVIRSQPTIANRTMEEKHDTLANQLAKTR